MISIIKKIGLASGLLLAFTLSPRLPPLFRWTSFCNRLNPVVLPMRLKTRHALTSFVPTVQHKANC